MEKRTIFLKFLVEHDALFPYINNLDLESIPDIFQNNSEYWIAFAFQWYKTSEGYNYWAILDNFWLKICSTL